MINEKHHALAQEARAINLSESLLFPLLESMIQQRQALMVSEFNGKDTNLLPHVAYIAALLDLKNILLNKQKQGNKAQEEISKHYNGEE